MIAFVPQTGQPQAGHYVIVCVEGSPAKIHKFDTTEDMVSLLKSIRSEKTTGRVQVFAFTGRRHLISAPPYSRIIIDGAEIPLFEIPKAAFEDGDEDGVVHQVATPVVQSKTPNYGDLTKQAHDADAASIAAVLNAPKKETGDDEKVVLV